MSRGRVVSIDEALGERESRFATWEGGLEGALVSSEAETYASLDEWPS